MTEVRLGVGNGPTFLKLMRHYVVDYTNAHDQTQTQHVMESDYVLRMGNHRLTGRDGLYAAATRRQLDQFPDLALTVHEIWTSGERLVMRFSEHGRSIRHGNARACWGGIGLYQWNGSRLTANNVEQDYASRARQLKTGVPMAVEPSAQAPWLTEAEAPDPKAEMYVRGWLENGGIDKTPGVLRDDEWSGVEATPLLDQTHITINDLFSCGPVVAFHASQHGTLAAGFSNQRATGDATLHVAGLVHLRGGVITRGRVVRNRIDLERSLRATQ